ncbi:MAG: glycoside hydrolase family 3 protein [Bacteroidales bacterium]|nr:glycoside hydrolase family 3 protein [Bacteroidales bacterium]
MKRVLQSFFIGSLFLLSGFGMMAQDTGQLRLGADNIDRILSAMTLKEKASLVVGAGYNSMLAGMFGFKVPVPGAAGMTRAVPRLGIPSIVLSDGPAGVRIEPERKGSKDSFYCTGFPIGSLLSSTWNPGLVERVGEAIGNEALEYGVDVLLAPGMNIQRNPLCGRNFEYYSEDPLLSGRIAAAYVRGVQSQGVGACLKHFAANNQETNRFWNDSRVTEDVLRAIYLKNFETALQESQPWTVMASYNRLNGTHTQEHHWLLSEVLREEWGYAGLVMTDWTGRRNTASQVSAGCDLMEPGEDSQINELIRKVKKGELPENELDICVRRVLELIVRTPSFKGIERSLHPDLAAHSVIAREAAEEGIVLLQNKAGTLPMRKGQRIALFGVGSYATLAGGTGSGFVHCPYVVNLDEGISREGFRPDAHLSDLYREYIKSHKPRRTFLSGMLGSPAVKEMSVAKSVVTGAAASSDVALLTISRQAGEGGDRHLEDDFLLSETERRLIADVCEAFHSNGKKVVVVLNVGGVIETASWKDLPDAIILAWQPGEEGGNALARILSGSVCPSGRLPVTFPADYFDLPSSASFPYDYAGKPRMTGGSDKDRDVPGVGYTEYSEGLSVGYRHYLQPGAPEPSFPFGFGLSYTSFSVSEPLCVDGNVTVTVTNTGTVPGKETVLLMDPVLRAFGKTRLLQPGESEILIF